MSDLNAQYLWVAAESVEKAEPVKSVTAEYKGPSAGCTAVVALVSQLV